MPQSFYLHLLKKFDKMKHTINPNGNKSYKDANKKIKVRDCFTSENAISFVVVDFRSRLFRYIRIVITNRSLIDKIKCIFGMVKNFDLEEEKRIIFCSALNLTKEEVSMLKVGQHTYVFPAQNTCIYKERITTKRKTVAEEKLKEFIQCFKLFKKNLLNLELLVKCHSAFESYLLSDLDGIGLMYLKSDIKVPSYTVPEADDFFESDRLCAKLSNSYSSAAVLSEDLDCLSLFGAQMIIKDVQNNFFSYISLKDVMKVFCSQNRNELVHKCYICGTDYNLGLNRVGHVTTAKIETKKAEEMFKYCMHEQPTPQRVEDMYRFFLLDN